MKDNILENYSIIDSTWSEEQTQISIQKQKKALFILIPIFAALFLYLNSVKDEFYVNNMQQVIEEFCENADYIKFSSSSFCNIESIQIENQGQIYLFNCENEDTCLS